MDAQNAAGAYNQLLEVSKNINRIALAAHLPIKLVSEVFIQDPQRKQEILRLLRAVETASAAPVLAEKRRLGYQDVQQSPDKMQAMRRAGQSVGGEYLLQSAPMVEDLLANLLMQR